MAKTSSNTLTSVKKYKSVNIHFYISSRATLKEIFTAKYDCVLPKTHRFAAIECFHVTSPGIELKRFLLFRRKHKVTDHVSENRHLVPYETLHSIYQALVQPHFNYCNIVWGNCGVTLQEKLQKLQKLQNRATRVLTYFNYDAHVNNLFELLRWKSLVSQRQIERATMVFIKSLQGLAPEYLCSKIVHRNSAGYCLKDSANKVNVLQSCTNYYKKQL